MIGHDNLINIFKKLDRELEKRNHLETIVIMGGSAVVAMGQSNRATVDINLARPTRVATEFQHAIEAVAKELQLSADWVNTASHIFTSALPKNFETRTVLVYSGKNLTVFRMSDLDLLFTKCLAYFDRKKDTDLHDIKKIAPKFKDLMAAQNWMMKHKSSDETKSEIIDFFDQLKIAILNSTVNSQDQKPNSKKKRTKK